MKWFISKVLIFFLLLIPKTKRTKSNDNINGLQGYIKEIRLFKKYQAILKTKIKEDGLNKKELRTIKLTMFPINASRSERILDKFYNRPYNDRTIMIRINMCIAPVYNTLIVKQW